VREIHRASSCRHNLRPNGSVGGGQVVDDGKPLFCSDLAPAPSAVVPAFGSRTMGLGSKKLPQPMSWRDVPYVHNSAPHDAHRPSACLALSAWRLRRSHPADHDLLLCLQPGTQINLCTGPWNTRTARLFRLPSLSIRSVLRTRSRAREASGARIGLIPASSSATVRGDVWIRPSHPRG
jgi:hypothetical protein